MSSLMFGTYKLITGSSSLITGAVHILSKVKDIVHPTSTFLPIQDQKKLGSIYRRLSVLYEPLHVCILYNNYGNNIVQNSILSVSQVILDVWQFVLRLDALNQKLSSQEPTPMVSTYLSDAPLKIDGSLSSHLDYFIAELDFCISSLTLAVSMIQKFDYPPVKSELCLSTLLQASAMLFQSQRHTGDIFSFVGKFYILLPMSYKTQIWVPFFENKLSMITVQRGALKENSPDEEEEEDIFFSIEGLLDDGESDNCYSFSLDNYCDVFSSLPQRKILYSDAFTHQEVFNSSLKKEQRQAMRKINQGNKRIFDAATAIYEKKKAEKLQPHIKTTFSSCSSLGMKSVPLSFLKRLQSALPLGRVLLTGEGKVQQDSNALCWVVGEKSVSHFLQSRTLPMYDCYGSRLETERERRGEGELGVEEEDFVMLNQEKRREKKEKQEWREASTSSENYLGELLAHSDSSIGKVLKSLLKAAKISSLGQEEKKGKTGEEEGKKGGEKVERGATIEGKEKEDGFLLAFVPESSTNLQSATLDCEEFLRNLKGVCGKTWEVEGEEYSDDDSTEREEREEIEEREEKEKRDMAYGRHASEVLGESLLSRENKSDVVLLLIYILRLFVCERLLETHDLSDRLSSARSNHLSPSSFDFVYASHQMLHRLLSTCAFHLN